MEETDVQNVDLKVGTCFFKHKWTKWAQFEQAVKKRDGFQFIEYRESRHCLKCGKTQMRNVTEF